MSGHSVLLEEVGPRRPLPRPGRIPRPVETPNVWDYDAGLPNADTQADSTNSQNGGDTNDYIAGAGIALFALGLLLSLLPATRAGGWLVPIGAAAIAGAAYVARRKDETAA